MKYSKNQTLSGFFGYVLFLLLSLFFYVQLYFAQNVDAHSYLSIAPSVEHIAYSPDGKWFAAATSMGIWLCDGRSYKIRQRLIDTSNKYHFFFNVAFSPNGKMLASVGANTKEIQLWNPGAGELITTLSGHTEGISNIIFSPDGKTLASSGNQEIMIWDIRTHKPRKTLQVHSGSIYSIAFSPDGKTLASSVNQKILLWNVRTGQLQKTFSGYTDLVHAVAFSPDGKTLASSGFQEILLWDASTGKRRKSLAGHKGTVESIAFSPDGKTLAGGSYQEILLWDIHEAKRRKTFTDPFKYDSGVSSIAYSPNGKKLASLSDGIWSGQIVLWDVKKGKHELIPKNKRKSLIRRFLEFLKLAPAKIM